MSIKWVFVTFCHLVKVRSYPSLQVDENELWNVLGTFLEEHLQALNAKHSISFVPKEDFHITLLWPGSRDEAEFERLEGKEIDFSITSICHDVEAGLIALRVSFDETHSSLCQNLDPHITVATLPGVAAKQSNNMLHRQRQGDASVIEETLPRVTYLKGSVQRKLTVHSMSTATAALGTCLREGNPLCELGLTTQSFDLWATCFRKQQLSELKRFHCSQPLDYCRWPPKTEKVWLTFHKGDRGVVFGNHVSRCFKVFSKLKTFQKISFSFRTHSREPTDLGEFRERANPLRDACGCGIYVHK